MKDAIEAAARIKAYDRDWSEKVERKTKIKNQEKPPLSGNPDDTTFKMQPGELARTLKNRYKDDFKAAMGAISFYVNRAGKKLMSPDKDRLHKAKEELRKLYKKSPQDKPTGVQAMTSIYETPCPTCSGRITSTARTPDDTKATSSCENGHTFTRAQAFTAAKKATAFARPLPERMVRAFKIEAASRLKAFDKLALTAAEQKLMARSTQLSQVAEKGVKDIVHLMTLQGYQAKTIQNKAYYETKFVKYPPKDEEGEPRIMELMGWSGSGRYGAEKTVFEFYDYDHGKKPVVTIGAINEENLNEENQLKVINDILKYIKQYG